MDKGRALLPWVISGLSMACLAIVVAVSANRPAPGISRAPSQDSVAVVPPAPAAAPATAPAANLTPAPAPMPAAPPLAASDLSAAPPLAAEPELATASTPPAAATAPGAQIWECRTNGQKTFSDKPCGDKPVLREVSALNIMNPTPILPTRYYEPEPEPSYAPEYPSAQEPTEAAYPVVGYPVVVGYPYYHRRRPDHAHRPYPQPYHHGPMPRKIQ
jgi:hypothetical protein